MFIDLREREGEGEGEGEGERREERRGEEKRRDTLMWERNIDQLPPVYTLTGDQTCNLDMCPNRGSNTHLLVYGTMLQPTALARAVSVILIR